MAYIVVYDANVLYPNTLRDLLIRISQAQSVEDVLSQLERDGLSGSVAALRAG